MRYLQSYKFIFAFVVISAFAFQEIGASLNLMNSIDLTEDVENESEEIDLDLEVEKDLLNLANFLPFINKISSAYYLNERSLYSQSDSPIFSPPPERN